MEENFSQIVKVVLGIVIAITIFVVLLTATGVLSTTTESLSKKGGELNKIIMEAGKGAMGEDKTSPKGD